MTEFRLIFHFYLKFKAFTLYSCFYIPTLGYL